MRVDTHGLTREVDAMSIRHRFRTSLAAAAKLFLAGIVIAITAVCSAPAAKAEGCPKHFYSCSLNAGGKIDPRYPGCCWDLTTDKPAKPVVQYCSDGSRMPESGRCPRKVEYCPDGSRMPESGRCPKKVEHCPDGSRMPESGRCPKKVEHCPDGSRMPESGRCPKKVEHCPDGSRMPDSGRCPRKEPVVEYKQCSNGERVPASSKCPEKTCLEGQRKNAAGDCYTVNHPTTPDPPRSAAVKINCNPGQGYPSSGDLPRSIYEIKIGSTSLFAGGYADVAPNRNDCQGVTANGCYLRVTDIPKVNGGSGQACVQFCKAELCPKTTLPQEIAHKPDPPPIPQPVVVPKSRGKPAVLTLIAPPYVVPKPRGKPAVPTLIAAPYVVPNPQGKPAVPTLIAAPYVVPKPRGKSAVPTLIAAPYVVPAPVSKGPVAGYQLFFDGKLVSGPDAASYSLAQAKENCAYNNKTKPNLKVECRYDGKPLDW